MDSLGVVVKGYFITFEGIDGCGKSTQVRRLGERLQGKGIDVVITREPGGTEISEWISKLVKDKRNARIGGLTELFLYMASRSQHVEEVIGPSVKEGKILVSERFSDSTLAYQGYGRQLDMKVISSLNSIATKGIAPDLTILIDLPVDVAQGRIEQRGTPPDRLESEDREFHCRVKKGYLEIARIEPQRVIIIDGSRGVESVWGEVKKVIWERLHSLLAL